MPKNLLIVESPAKAKTIEKYLGKDYTVKSSVGHIRDLDKGTGAVDIENNFALQYVISPEKHKVVRDLKAAVKKADTVWLATDEDREGEAISWHLCEVLGLDIDTTKRIVFREITKPAIQKAIQEPRQVDIKLVNAQQARRVLDRLVGYELSGVLWKKVRGRLSGGRVQSVAVKLIVEREREILGFEPTSYYNLKARFEVKNKQGKLVNLEANSGVKFSSKEEVADILNKSVGADYTINDIQIKPKKRHPAAPFTTSTLQQEASRKLHFAVKRTMMAAQRLYEAGHITYMRTDSTSLSELAIQNIATEISNSFGEEYLNIRRFKTKKAGAQEAHEAIRPTYIEKQNVSGDSDEQRLYELIRKRTIASQMASAQIEETTAIIDISTVDTPKLKAVGEVLKFDGFLKVYIESKDDDDQSDDKKMLPPLVVGQKLDLGEMNALERYTRAPARFTEAGLVSQMEKLGIGRPSTYAPTISKIMDPNRGYVVKETREGEPKDYQLLMLKDGKVVESVKTEMAGAVKNRLFPTDIGMIVSDFLSEHFTKVMDYNFTAEIEGKFDYIAEGKAEWKDMLSKFYFPFHETVEDTIENAERPSNERILGVDPESGRTVLTRMSRRGPVIQIGTPEELGEDEKPRYANFAPGQNLDTITFEEAMKRFELPRTLGNFQDLEVVIASGRFGPYIRHDGKYVSLPKTDDPFTVDLERASELILEKQKADEPIGYFRELPITKGVGRFGPFVKWDGKFVSVPKKKYNFDELTIPEAIELIEAKLEKDANRYITVWEDEGITVENGRWGPFVKYKKKNVKIPRPEGEKKISQEYAASLTLEQVKAMIEDQLPGMLKEKKKTTRKKATTKKTTAKKKTTTKKK